MEHGLTPRWTLVAAARSDWRSAGPIPDWRAGDAGLALRRTLHADPARPVSASLGLLSGEVPGVGARAEGLELRFGAGRALARGGFAQVEVARRQWRGGVGQTRIDAAAALALTGRWQVIAGLNGEAASLTGARSGARLRASVGLAARLGERRRLEIGWRDTVLADDDWRDRMATVTIQSRF